MNAMRPIRWFEEIGIEDVPLVGGKNASLGEMYRELTAKGVKVPNGFAVTADAYRYFLRESGLDRRLREILEGLDTRDMENLRQRGRQAREAILEAEPARRPRAGDRHRLRASCRRAAPSRSTSPCAAAPPPRTCRTPASPGSRKPT